MSEHRSFAIIADGEVFHYLELYTGVPPLSRLSNALAANPTVINCSEDSQATEIEYGWTWDGYQFNPPA